LDLQKRFGQQENYSKRWDMPCCFSSLASALACSHEVRFMAERVSSIPMDDKSDLTHQTGLRHKEGGNVRDN